MRVNSTQPNSSNQRTNCATSSAQNGKTLTLRQQRMLRRKSIVRRASARRSTQIPASMPECIGTHRGVVPVMVETTAKAETKRYFARRKHWAYKQTKQNKTKQNKRKDTIMKKIVININFGGFSLSTEAILLARELSGNPHNLELSN